MTLNLEHDEERTQRLRARRLALSDAVGGEPVLLVGHHSQSRNFLANERPFRQDSTFLYFVGVSLPGVAALIERGGRTTLYLRPTDPGDVLWTGPMPAPEQWQRLSGADQYRSYDELQPGSYLTLPLCEQAGNAEASRLSGQELDPRRPAGTGSASLRQAVIGLRMCRDAAEIAEHRAAVEVTAPTSMRPAAPPSRLDSEMFHALEQVQQEMFPDAVTVPTMLVAATDSAQLRANGIQAYGVGMIRDDLSGVHGNDERISIEGLGLFVEYLYRVVVEVAGASEAAPR